jgi:hypothetical protein
MPGMVGAAPKNASEKQGVEMRLGGLGLPGTRASMKNP